MRRNIAAWLLLPLILSFEISYAGDEPPRPADPAAGTKPPEPPPPPREGRRPAGPRPLSLDAAKIDVIRLKHAVAVELVPILMQVFGPTGAPLLVNADDATNSLIVVSESEVARKSVNELVQELDSPRSENARNESVTQIVPITNTDAMNIAQILNAVRSNGPQRPVRIVGDPHSNTVVLSGDSAAVQQQLALIERMDQAPRRNGRPGDGDRQLQFFELKSANAESLAATVSNVIKMTRMDAMVTADASSGTLILWANPHESEELMKVIQRLDVPRKAPPPVTPPAAKDIPSGSTAK